MKRLSILPILASLLLVGAPAFPQTSHCQGLVKDKTAHPMTALAKPALGAAVNDPQFGTRIRRISAVPGSGIDPAIRPMYSTTAAWSADESLLLLYEVGKGHRLYDGWTYQFLRYLDIRPVDLEQVYWDATNPAILHYIDGRTVIRYNVLSGQKQALHTFTGCSSNVAADSHAFTSWDSRLLGLSCDGNVFAYDLSTGAVSGSARSSLSPPMAAPSGQLMYFHGLVLDPSLRVLRSLDIAEPDTHSSLGKTASGHDLFNGAMYDPGPRGSGVGSLVAHDMTSGSSKVIIGPATGYPYPPSGTHISSLVFQRPGWAFVSIVGDPTGRGVLDNEIVLANVDSGEVCRVVHHRSYGKNNTRLATPYWAEPHVVASPSGTRALFASDWGNGSTVDAYVAELPSYQPPPAGLRLTLSSDRTSYRVGDTLSLSMRFQNVGTSPDVDVYFLVVPPGGSPVVFFRNWQFQMNAVDVSAPSTWPAIASRVALNSSFSVDLPSIYQATWKASDPAGTYGFYFFATQAGALSDNRFDASELVSSASAVVTFAR